MTEPEYRELIVATARSWIGTPWKRFGRTRNGIDCGGLVICVAREVGALHFELDALKEHYEMGVNEGVWQWPHFDEVPWEDRAPGDIVMASHYANSDQPWHVGFSSEKDGVETLIHYERHYAKVVEEEAYQRTHGRTCRAYRVPWPPRAIDVWYPDV